MFKIEIPAAERAAAMLAATKVKVLAAERVAAGDVGDREGSGGYLRGDVGGRDATEVAVASTWVRLVVGKGLWEYEQRKRGRRKRERWK